MQDHPTVTLSYVLLSKATNMLTNMITDKTKNIKYKIATISEVRLVWDSICSKSVRPNTDHMSCLEVLNMLEVTKRNCDLLGFDFVSGKSMYLSYTSNANEAFETSNVSL